MRWAKSLWQDPDREIASHSRLLSLAAFVVTSWVIVKMELREATSYELVIGYLAVMVTGEAYKRVSMSSQRTEITRERIRSRVDNPDEPMA